MATRTRPQTKSSSKQVAVHSNQQHQQAGQKKTIKTHVVEQLNPFNVGVFCACSTLVGGALSIYMTNYWFGKKATEKANQDKKDLAEHRNGFQGATVQEVPALEATIIETTTEDETTITTGEETTITKIERITAVGGDFRFPAPGFFFLLALLQAIPGYNNNALDSRTSAMFQHWTFISSTSTDFIIYDWLLMYRR
ncbi:hypothetical protein AC579_7183 [Pseudocercospora musae]|uniref:Uncharacterized protein n=1 Tax=Pseudocercospora musae TaxID=113226 RepID=A0A139I8K4_9PEZI|nr:hypothetical protein AC579_7183 [Pseudocercospora musae]